MKAMWTQIVARFIKCFATLAKGAASASVWLMFFGLGGPALIIAGVYILLGLGWAFVVGGVACIAIANLIAKGIAHA